MTRILIVLTLSALAAAALPAAAVAKDAGEPSFSHDRASGTFEQALFEVSFEFDARSDPLGRDPSGTFSYTDVFLSFAGEVECLVVTGTTAAVGGVITQATGDAGDFGLGVGSRITWTVQDNGPGEGLDLISDFYRVPSELPATCSPIPVPLRAATVVVEDAQCVKLKPRKDAADDKCKL
jgi:hypothetical protein